MPDVRRVIVCWSGLGLLALAGSHAGIAKLGARVAPAVHAQAPALRAQGSPPSGLLDRYCASCHNPRLLTAGLSLSDADSARAADAAQVWEKVVSRLRAGTMPPAGLPRPDPSAARALASSLASSLDRAWAANPDPGRTPPLHRLNRAEYTNAVRDLLAVEVDGRALLPPDDSNHGFDSMASVLTVSPLLIERYLSAARRISRIAVGDPALGPASASSLYQLPPLLFQDDWMSDDLPFGSRGGAAIRHRFPLDGTYVIKVRLQKNYVDYVRGLGAAHQLQLRLDGVRIHEFTVGGGVVDGPAPVSYAGNISGSAAWERYALSADEGLEFRFQAGAGTHVVGVAFVRQPGEPEGVLQPLQNGFAFASDQSRSSPSGPEGPAVESVQIEGPYAATGPGDTASRRRIFVCRPGKPSDDERCARTVLQTLARRAYRRPVTERDLQTLVGFFRSGRQEGTFDTGIQSAIERLLVDPDFLFRIERDPPKTPPGTVYHINDLELASRLSFFLWSSIPDEELLDLAIRGRLRTPAVVEQQVRRMLADRRSTALVENFASQWLSIRKLQEAAPNPDLFSEFDENLREAFRTETQLFIGSQIAENRSLVGLLTADYTFLNERLARHYGIPGVYGSHFRRVGLADQMRPGLLGQGGILTATSYGTRTSPVLRGHWLLENILGTPPPPPPPDVPGLAERGDDGRPASIRERMERHRRNPACATCHLPMDPLGFALENFDAIGRWRTVDDAGTAIDASGSLPDGAAFEGVAGLRQYLASHREQFVETLVDKLLAYALGRGVEYFDRPAIRRVTRDAAAADYRWSGIILNIVNSVPFQMRRAGS